MKIKGRIASGFLYLCISAIVIIAIPFLLLWLLFELLATPFNYIKRQRSRYQQDFPKKYKLFEKSHADNKIYTIIKDNNLPIDYFKHPGDYELHGYFLYKGILLNFIDEPFYFDKEEERWIFYFDNYDDGEEEDESNDKQNDSCELSFDETKELFTQDFRNAVKERECNHVIFFCESKKAEKQYGIRAVEKLRGLDGVILYKKGELKEAVIEYIKGSESAFGDKKAPADWTAPFKGLDLRGGKLIIISNDDEDMLEINWSDGMCIDVGYVNEDKTYYITTTANDTLEAWNSPLSDIKTQNRDELPGILQQEIIRCRS